MKSGISQETPALTQVGILSGPLYAQYMLVLVRITHCGLPIEYTLIGFSNSNVELFMAQDRSPGFSATWDFLDRRLRDMQNLDKVTSEIGDYVGFTAFAFMNILRSKNIMR